MRTLNWLLYFGVLISIWQLPFWQFVGTMILVVTYGATEYYLGVNNEHE